MTAVVPDPPHPLPPSPGTSVVLAIGVAVGPQRSWERDRLGFLERLPLVRDHHPVLGVRRQEQAGDVAMTVLTPPRLALLWDELEIPADLCAWQAFALAHEVGVLVLRDVGPGALDGDGAALSHLLSSGIADQYALSTFYGPLVVALPADPARRAGHWQRINAAAFTGENTLLTGGYEGALLRWDVTTGRALETVAPRGLPVRALSVSPGGTHLAVERGEFTPDEPLGSGLPWILGRELSVLRLDHPARPLVLTGGQCAWSPDGAHLAWVSKRSPADQGHAVDILGEPGEADEVVVRVWDARTGRQWACPGTGLHLPAGRAEILVSQRASATGGTSSALMALDGSGPRLVIEGSRPAVDPRGELALTFASAGTAHLVRLDDGAVVARIELDTGLAPQEAVFSPEGHSVLLPRTTRRSWGPWDSPPGEAVVFNLRTRRVAGILGGTAFRYSPTGRWIVAVGGGGRGTLRIHDSVSLAVVGDLVGGGATFTGRDSRVAVASSRWDEWGDPPGPVVPEPPAAAIWRLSREGVERIAEVRGVEPLFSPSGRRLVMLLPDGRACLYDGDTGAPEGLLGDIREIGHAAGDRTIHFGGAPIGSSMGPLVADPTELSRSVQASHPAQACPGATFEVKVALLRAGGSQSLDMLASVDEDGRDTGAPPLVIQARPSSAFTCTSPAQVSVPVPAIGDPAPAVFSFRCGEAVRGPQEINLVLVQGNEVLGQLRLVVTVVRTPSGRTASTTLANARRPWYAPRARPPDAVITVNRTRYREVDSLHYSYEWVARGWPAVDAGTVDLHSSAAEWTAGQYAGLSRFARTPVGPPGPHAVADLARLGENLYREIVPPDLRAFLAQFLPTATSLLIYTNEPWIPWELLKPWGDGLPPAGTDFLCAQLALGRWYYSDEGNTPAARIEARHVGTILSTPGLPAVHAERRYLEDLPRAWPPLQLCLPPPTTASDVLATLGSGRVEILHFATHGASQSDGARVVMLDLGGEEFAVDHLVGSEVAQGVRASGPLVFMNACHSARRTPGLVRTQGWAERFLDLGSRAFIGANWEVHDALACTVACTVYDRLREGDSLGRAVQQARAVVRAQAPGNSTWLAYTLYGHPNATVRAH